MGIHLRGRRTTTALTTLTALLATGLVAAPAYAADLVVTTTDDSGPGSLREALTQANASAADDRITFAVNGTIQLTSDQLEASVGGDSGDLVVEGPGADTLTIDGQWRSRILDVVGDPSAGTPSVTLSGLTLARGFVADTRWGEDGGGLRVQGARVGLDQMSFVDNRAASGYLAGSGGGVSVTSGPGDEAELEVRESTFTTNRASEEGGAIHGGQEVPVTVIDSVVSDNQASFSGSLGYEAWGTSGEGGGVAADSLTLVGSTVAGNYSPLDGGGLHVGSLAMNSSTVSGNRAKNNGGGIDASGAVRVISSTIVGNRARISGGGIRLSDTAPGLDLVLTTVAGNAAMSGGGVQLPGRLTASGTVLGSNAGGDLAGGGRATLNRSLVQDASDVDVTDAGGAVLGPDPVLKPLAEAGGSTATMVPAPGSPVVDTGSAFGEAVDQRGAARTVDEPSTPDVADGTDIGAVEQAPAESVGAAQVEALVEPTLRGVARVGETLRATPGRWSPEAVTLSYQWLRNGYPIDGADARTYEVTGSDRGGTQYGDDRRVSLSVVVTAQAPGYDAAVVETDPSGFVGRGSFTMDGGPRVVGRTRVGATLHARPRTGALTPTPEWTGIYWFVGKREYDGEGRGDLRLDLTRAMRGKRVRVVFEYHGDGVETARRVVRVKGTID